MNKPIFTLLIACGIGCACVAVVNAEEVDFARDIAPIFEQHCLHCHGEDEQESGLRLDRRASMMRGGDSGLAAVVPGKPDKSYLIEVINHVDEEMAMPPDEDKIPAAEIELLTRWIKQGAVWPGQMAAAAEEKSDHWSFQPIVRPPIPGIPTRSVSGDESGSDGNGADSSLTRRVTKDNPIDAFLLQQLTKNELTFSASADPRSLIRRASIVITGLPPTPEENDAFLTSYADDPEKAYAALVDRLLESPHFGERWAQHWLDVIRWAETNGSESNMYRKNAWIYRDYVIRAFNEDKPYDQFLFEQIAGDTVGQGDATGYLVSGPHVPVATVGQEPSARRQARADRMDEILQTVGASALGVTIGCARCHNHKFDPISINDYYSMSAVFQDIEFGSRFPELAEDHPRRVRGKQLYDRIFELHAKLRDIGPWEEDWTGYKELHVPMTATSKVRITFNWDGVRLDEIEIFGPTHQIPTQNASEGEKSENGKQNVRSRIGLGSRRRPQNLALASYGTQAFSPVEMAVVRAELYKVNDGQFGTEGWSGKAPEGSQQKPFVEFTFPTTEEFNRIRLSTNREDFLETDYLEGLNKYNFGGYRVEVQDVAGNWEQVASTMNFEQLNKEHPRRAAILAELQTLIHEVNEEGPKPSFVARFIEPVTTHVLGRGSPENPREEVIAAGLKELDGDLGLPPDAPGRKRRRAFAEWITDESNPLTSRVAVNRLWHHVFGRGIVTTTSDFGAAGAPPTHPELLDWLAAEFMEPIINPNPNAADPNPKRGTEETKDADLVDASGDKGQPWSMKHMIRLMVMSHAFRQKSLPREDGLAVDADASLLWRFPPKRLEAEVIRDSVLRASGSLDLRIGGRSYRIHNVKQRYSQWEVVDNFGPETWRRMIYQERMRRVDDQMFTAFDFPDCGQVRARRPVSTTPLQALNLMNSSFVMEQSKLIAQRALREAGDNPAKALDRCFGLLLGRDPTSLEREACQAVAREDGLALVCRALINSNEFAFLP